MSRLRVLAYSVSLDGFAAGPDQSLAAPLGIGGEKLHSWFFPTSTFRQMVLGAEGGTTGVDDRYGRASFENIGAWILGRNMFTPERGPWADPDWKGWWGEEPPYHCQVFVLTHHPRAPIEMQGGTTFHFVTEGPRAALDRARAAAGGRDVRVGGGAETIRQYLNDGLVDDLHIAISPVLLGRGENLFAGLDLTMLGYQVTGCEAGEGAIHYRIERK